MIAASKLVTPREAARDDKRLVEECRQGNGAAWNALIDKYKNLIYSIPIKLGLHDEAGDIFQSVCLDLLNQIHQIREPRALAKWIMQAAYHRCLRQKAQAARIAHGDEADEAVQSGVAVESLADDLLLQLEREQAVRQAVGSLSERCQELVRLLFFTDSPSPYADIAAQLGLATGSVGFIRGRCLAALKKSLQKAGL